MTPPYLRDAYRAYRLYARHARETKTKLDRSRRLVVLLGLLAAVFGLGCEIFQVTLPTMPAIARFCGSVSIVSVVAAVIAGQLFSRRDWQSRWVRCRSLAESIKSECYRCAIGVGAYSDRPEAITGEVAELTRHAIDLKIDPKLDSVNNAEIAAPMTMDQYVQQRLRDQIDGFYRRRQHEFERNIGLAKQSLVLLAAFAIGFGVLGMLGFRLFASAIGAVTSVSAAIGVLVYSSRMPYLAISYGQTASALRRRLEQWESDREKQGESPELNSAFVEQCELIIANENDQWRIVADLEDA